MCFHVSVCPKIELEFLPSTTARPDILIRYEVPQHYLNGIQTEEDSNDPENKILRIHFALKKARKELKDKAKSIKYVTINSNNTSTKNETFIIQSKHSLLAGNFEMNMFSIINLSWTGIMLITLRFLSDIRSNYF